MSQAARNWRNWTLSFELPAPLVQLKGMVSIAREPQMDAGDRLSASPRWKGWASQTANRWWS